MRLDPNDWLTIPMNNLWAGARNDCDRAVAFNGFFYDRFRGIVELFRWFQQEPLRLVWYVHKGDDHYQRREYYEP